MSTLQFLNPKIIRSSNCLLPHTVVIQQGKQSHPGPQGTSTCKFYSCSAEWETLCPLQTQRSITVHKSLPLDPCLEPLK